MNILYALFVITVLLLLVSIGVQVPVLAWFFGVIIPYIAILIFIVGICYRVIKWARAPVPFRIPTTCGQQKSLPWIKSSNLEAPYNTLGVLIRMVLEVLFFRSLFRNTKQGLKDGPKLVYGSNYYLWLGALAFHWSFLIIFIRHYRFFSDPVPFFVNFVQYFDGLFQIGVPILYLTDVVIVAALTYLFLRRVLDLRLRYISLVADYFALFLLLGIVLSGILMRYFFKTDIVAVKELTIGLLSFHPTIPEGVGTLFFIHLFMVSVLLIYFPFSKLLHLAGVFLSPTRNLTANSREKRHINPWNYPVKVHTYEEWEEDFKEKMKKAGYTLERE
ncbi:sulfate reduction electron transfer complex DsrMKJOP subunit DsrM [candidate division CSSED10-310 bacterium]|uniref:Sulfate reduction electron transfer complex DsrMKJOP subunit DsrM n=1 Tax=candidate division CSSED10-310 bacterium TaxID=2855610 RepID=A0ABV6YRT3_UNCC1